MCGRFALVTDHAAMSRQFGVTDCPDLIPHYNIAPSASILAIRADNNQRKCVALRWGLIPAWSKSASVRFSTSNARAETVAEKPAFRNAFRQRRCLIPASGFYEWQTRENRKIPWHIRPRGGGLFAFAGLWEHWQQGDESIDSCTIIVTVANELMQPLHARMPVILPPERYADWLNPARSRADVQNLLVPCAATGLEAFPVSALVNNPRNDSPACLLPQTAAESASD